MTRYYWTILVGPKLEDDGRRGMRYHAKERLTSSRTEWSFDEQNIPLMLTGMLLIRIMIGKVEDKVQLVSVLCNISIRQGQPGWNCVIWVKEVLEGLKADEKAMGTSVLEWESMRDEAMKYCQRKRNQHRFDGQGSYNSSKAPTYDLVEGKETIVWDMAVTKATGLPWDSPLEVTKILLPNLLHSLFCRKWVQKFADLLYPERILRIDLAGSDILPIWREPASSLPVHNANNLVSLGENV